MTPPKSKALEKRVMVSGFTPTGNMTGPALTGTGKGVDKGVKARDHASGAMSKECK